MFDTTNLIESKTRNGFLVYKDKDGILKGRQCTKCGELKAIDGFEKKHNEYGGFRSQCRICRNIARNIYGKSERGQETRRAYLNSERGRKAKREGNKRYNAKYPEKRRESEQRRRHTRKAKLKNVTSDIDVMVYNRIKSLQFNRCLLTGESENLHFEHFIPISVGGGNTFDNCYFMDGYLNSIKSDHNPFEWIKTQPDEYQDRFHSVLVPMLAARNDMTVEEFTEYVYWCFENPRTIEDLQQAAT